uniref:Peroxin-13 n=1 Tax=Timspurckia oligopyrenoides TaxID=708627 RepID=A0A7S0ZFF9_9RHOD|mmetsp:Transcript_3306/g.5798  ORF Transcript_3306/g.5798 Transcript_3306/m.5798 type:complete len:303 (+) Transcript_3306:88-996(+)
MSSNVGDTSLFGGTEGIGGTGNGIQSGAARDVGSTNVPGSSGGSAIGSGNFEGGGLGTSNVNGYSRPFGTSASMYGSGGMYGGSGGFYGSSPYSGGMYRSPYSSMYGGYGGSGMYGGSGLYGGSGFGAGPLGSMAGGVMGPGGEMLNGMHSVMHSFARVSGLLEEVLRNFHMIFESVFGLFYSLSNFKQELQNVFGISIDKLSVVPLVKRAFRRLLHLWRIISLVLLSPLAGRFSPVAIVLRLLGVAPESANTTSRTSPLEASSSNNRTQGNSTRTSDTTDFFANEFRQAQRTRDDPDSSSL